MQRPSADVEQDIVAFACAYGDSFSKHLITFYGSSTFSKGVLIPFFVLSFAFVGRQAVESGLVSASQKEGFYGLGANFIVTDALKEKTGWLLASRAQREYWRPLVDMMLVIDGTIAEIGTHMFRGASYVNDDEPVSGEAEAILQDVPMVLWTIQSKLVKSAAFVAPQGLTAIALKRLYRFLACCRESGALLDKVGLVAAKRHEF